ncbi:MAG: hypothetical protein KDA25_09775, partial [Phycisphaerales bacterium]|nr:hypothetical protein [Phycisphaerales bacterium]
DITVTGYADGGGLLLTNGQNFLLGPDNVLQNNRYPVELGFDVAGLLPGSVVPASGNTNNYVFDSADYDPGGNITWAALDVPYVVDAWRFMNALRVMPGATVQFKSGAGFGVETRSDLIALGTPEAPITFEGFGGGAWDGLTYLFIGSGVRLDHCTIRDAEDAVALIETLIKTDNCLFRDNGVALKSGYDAIVRSSRLVDNTVGIESPFDADGTTNPNVFDGNGIAVIGDASDTARSNWWGAPNGPQAPGNPGDGDAIVGPVPYAPFLTEPPVATNHPPTVRLMESPLPLYVPGRKMIFHWAADDDDSIVSQRVLFSDFGHYPNEFTVVADDLHPAQRSFEFVIPDVGLDVANAQQAIRIEAVDAHGQVGWDEQTMYITVAGLEGDLEFTSDFDQVFQPGDSLDLTWSITGLDGELSGLDGSILFDADSEFVPLGVQTFIAMPDVSTDSARITIAAYGGLNRLKYFFSPEFSIRPDPLVGDEPPTVTLTSGGGAYAGGDIVPLSWTASDDEGIHSFVLMASYDGGETWHDLTEDLAPDARSHDWQLPTSTGIDEVRVRVVVRDRRFQNSSDDASFALLPGTYVPGSIADLNGDGAVDAADLALLLAAWDTAGADLNGDGTTNAADLAALLVEWTG